MNGAAAAATLAAGRWTLRPTPSCAGFAVRNLGLRTVRGQVPIRDAWIDVAADGRAVEVHAVLDLAGIDTGNAHRDSDLRKPGLLGTERFPTMTFSGGPAEPIGDTWAVPGRLAACGAEVELDLAGTVTERADSDEIAVSVTTSFDRRALGIRAPRFLIGRRIQVTVDATFSPQAG